MVHVSASADRLARGLRFGLFARTIFSEFISRAAGNLYAAVAYGALAKLAGKRTNPACFALDGRERINTRSPRIKPRTSVPVKEFERVLRGCVPVAIRRRGVATDTTKLVLESSR